MLAGACNAALQASCRRHHFITYSTCSHTWLVQASVRDNLDPLKLHTDRALIAVLKQVGTWCLSSLFGPSAAKLPPAELASVLSCLPMFPTRCLQATLQMSVTA